MCVCKGPNNSIIKTEMLKQLGSVNSSSLTKVAEELSCDTRLRLKGAQSAQSARTRSLTHTEMTSGAGAWWYYWLAKKKKTSRKKNDSKRQTIHVANNIKQKCEDCTQHNFKIKKRKRNERQGVKHLFNINISAQCHNVWRKKRRFLTLTMQKIC